MNEYSLLEINNSKLLHEKKNILNVSINAYFGAKHNNTLGYLFGKRQY